MLFRQRPRLRRPPADGARGRRLHYTLPAENDGRVLVRNAGGIELLSNVCRHRQAIMLNGRGNADNIVCPLHRWTYDLTGQAAGRAPFRADNPALNLGSTPLQNWRGLLFEGPRDVARRPRCSGHRRARFDFSGYVLDHVEIHECAYNWKTFIEVYLEDYHVEPFHPGLGHFVSCDDLRWDVRRMVLGADGRHPAGPAQAGNRRSTSAGSEQMLRFGDGQLPAHGAIWLTYYPNLMVEWYPHVLVVSTLVPRGPQQTTNIVEFYYPEEIALFEREFVEAERAAYMETAIEDDEIALRMDAGRRALLERGDDDAGPYQSPMEDGMQHFHEFLRRRLGPL